MKRTEFRKGMLVLAGAALVLAAGLGGELPIGQGMAQAQQAHLNWGSQSQQSRVKALRPRLSRRKLIQVIPATNIR